MKKRNVGCSLGSPAQFHTLAAATAVACIGVLPGAVALAVEDPGPASVLVVANSTSAASMAVATHYQTARGLPATNRCDLEMPDVYTLPYDDFVTQLKGPLAQCIADKGLSEQVLFIVLTRGIPGVISGAGEDVIGQDLTSVDSFLVDLFSELDYAENPYYKSKKRFTRENGYHGYLVTRLDGPTTNVAMDLVDRALPPDASAPEISGTAYLDLEPNGDNPVDRGVIAGAGADGNGQVQHAADLLSDAGWPVVLDSNDAEFGTAPALLTCPDARWYFGWYKAFNYNDAFEWRPGAAGVHLDSFSAMNYREPGSWCAGALSKGITATAGAVWEPYILWYMKGDLFLEAFVVDRVTLAEAAYRAIPRNCWMMVVFGDPLFQLEVAPPLPEPAPELSLEPAPEMASDTSEAVSPPLDSGAEMPNGPRSDAFEAEPTGEPEIAPVPADPAHGITGKHGGGCSPVRPADPLAALLLALAVLTARVSPFFGSRRARSGGNSRQ